MALGAPICALRGSVPRTSGNGSGGSQTPTAGAQRKSRRAIMKSVDNGRRSGGGQSSSPGLGQGAEPTRGKSGLQDAAGWPTPQTYDVGEARKDRMPGQMPTHSYRWNLKDAAQIVDNRAGWRSPNLGSGITLDRLVTKDGEPWTPGQRAYDKDTGRLCEVGLDQEVQLAGWLSPQADDSRGVGGAGSRENHQSMLHHQVQKAEGAAGWPTARATDSIVRHSQRWMRKRIEEHRDVDLTTMANTAGYPTPRTVTGGPESGERKKELGRTKSGGGDLQSAALLFGTGQPSGTSAQTGRPGGFRLNPFFAGWMMGYPREWTFSGLRAVTRSPGKSKGGRQSSKGTATR